jgi:hypothetical protein
MGFKASSDPPLPLSNLAPDVFVLAIQTPYQRKCYGKWGRQFMGVDATHNTTYYENMSPFTLIVRDRHGHGMPVAFMISSDATENTVDWFFATFRRLNWEVIPLRIMCDHDRATMNVIRRRYIESQMLLCWWHVPHAWQKHFCVAHYPELWAEMKQWFRITDPDEFMACWARIQQLAPESVISYLVKTWMVDKELWSGVFRQDRTIFELGDTNMLVEA